MTWWIVALICFVVLILYGIVSSIMSAISDYIFEREFKKFMNERQSRREK